MKNSRIRFFRKFLHWRLNQANSYYFTILISIFIGLFAGLSSVLIKNTVDLIKHFVQRDIISHHSWFIYILAPAFGIILTLLFIKYILREHIGEGEGIPKVLHAISKNQAFIKFHETFSKIITSALTVGFGGSAGLEGPAVATGAAIGSNIGRYFKIPYRQKIIFIGAAAAAAISSIFKSPITGVVFALEVIMIDLTTQSILPILIASVTGLITSYFLTGTNVIYFTSPLKSFELSQVPVYIIIGIISGFVAVYFSFVYISFSRMFKKIKKFYKRTIIGAGSLGLLLIIFPSLFGEGFEVMNSGLNGNFSYIFDGKLFAQTTNFTVIIILLASLVLLKIISTSLTIGAGGVGGIFAPMLFTGMNLGVLIAFLAKKLGYDLPMSNSALVAMSGIIAGVLQAPLTGIFLIAEITQGYELVFPLMIVSTISFVIVRLFYKNNIYSFELAQKNELLTHHADKNALFLIDINDIIEKDFYKLNPEFKLRKIVDIVVQTHRNLFPVLDDEGHLLGIISLDRLRKIMFKQDLYDKIKASDLMEMPEIAFIVEKDSPEDIAEKLQKAGTFNIVVLKNAKYEGFISRANFFSHYRNLLRDFSSE